MEVADEGIAMADSDVNLNMNNCDDGCATFDVQRFLRGLDAIFDAHKASEQAEPYLQKARTEAEHSHNDAGLLTVLNETMGFYRSQGRHTDNLPIIRESLSIADHLHLQEIDPQAWATTLINAATGMRAAGQYEEAEQLYRQAFDAAASAFSPTDRRLAALHNNMSMLYSETGRLNQAKRELEQALDLLEQSSPDASADIDVASTHTNLALLLLQMDRYWAGDAIQHAQKALKIYRTGHLEHSAHYASALAGYAQACYMAGCLQDAVSGYEHALSVIEECYGRNTDYYHTTAANLEAAKQTMHRHAASSHKSHTSHESDGSQATHTTQTSQESPVPQRSQQSQQLQQSDELHASSAATTVQHPMSSTAATYRHISGLALARAFWNDLGKPLVADTYSAYQGRIAAGLVGYGSECFGFDDELSRDHDFAPRFCLWLTDEDYDAIGKQLQADYDALSRDFTVDEQGKPHFAGHGSADSDALAASQLPLTPRAQGEFRRDGVFRIGDFFERITLFREAPAQNDVASWLSLQEDTLATATNGQVFADPLGVFSKTRQGFKFMPEDVRLSLISRRLGMMAQAGQYNLPRMLQRGDGAAAMLSIHEFVNATASLMFLINEPVSVGYLPYYKWQFAAMRKLSRRMATRLAGVCEQLEDILRLSSAACFGGAGFGEGGKGAKPAAKHITATVERICSDVVDELLREGLTESHETFVEWQRPYVENHIKSDASCLHSL